MGGPRLAHAICTWTPEFAADAKEHHESAALAFEWEALPSCGEGDFTFDHTVPKQVTPKMTSTPRHGTPRTSSGTC